MQITKTWTRRPLKKARYNAADVSPNRMLTNISVAYMNREMDSYLHGIFPAVPVNESIGTYSRFTKDDFLRLTPGTKRKPGTEFQRVTFGADKPTFTCVEHGLEAQLPDEDADAQDSPLQATVMSEFLSQQMLIVRENDFFQNYIVPTSGVWGSYQDGGTSDFVQWNATGATIIQDLRSWMSTVRQNCAMTPNVIAMTQDVWDVVQDDEDVIDRIKYTSGNNNPAVVTRQNFAAMMGVDEVRVGSAVYNSANEGDSYSGSYFSTDRVWVGYRAPTPSTLVPSAGYTFSWSPFDRVRSDSGLGAAIMQYREEKTMSDIFRGLMFFEHAVVAADAGLLAHDVLDPDA